MDGLSDRNKQIGAGVLAIGLGLLMLAMVNLHPEGAQAPLWVINAAISTFILAGVSIVANALGFPFIGRLAGAALVWMLAVPGLWILLDGEGAQCTASVSLGGLSTVGAAGSGLCRMAFGIGGLLTVAIAIGFTVLALRHRAPASKQGTDVSGSMRSN